MYMIKMFTFPPNAVRKSLFPYFYDFLHVKATLWTTKLNGRKRLSLHPARCVDAPLVVSLCIPGVIDSSVHGVGC